MAYTSIVLSPALPSELLSYILSQQAYPTTLIICQPRTSFLSSLLADIVQTSAPQFHAPPSQASSEAPEELGEPPEQPPVRHLLLIPTLRQVVASRYINLVFVHTLSHLRAYLAVFPPRSATSDLPQRKFDKPGKKVPLLVVYGLVGLHRNTSEWSAQGLGNSLSGLVEAGWRARRGLVVIEERTIEEKQKEVSEDTVDDVEQQGKKEAFRVSDERVPMLNGSLRRVGVENENGGWSGRTVEVERILGRWFKFRKGVWGFEDGV